MSIQILIDRPKKGYNYCITIGRKSSWHGQVDLITICREWRHNKEITYAEMVKAFFRKKIK